MSTIVAYNGSNSRIPNGRQQIQMEVSQDEVIFIANVNRHLMKVIKAGFIFHQALLVVTSKIGNQKIGKDKKYHLVEFEDDSVVKGYQINIQIKNNPNYLNELTQFEDEEHIWEKMSIKYQFDIDTLNITVKEIMKRMQDVANQNGSYNLLSNNCQSVANQLTEQLLLENISNKNLIFLALVEKQDSDYKEGGCQLIQPCLLLPWIFIMVHLDQIINVILLNIQIMVKFKHINFILKIKLIT